MSKRNEPSVEPARSARRPYQAPLVARVDLQADEVLVSGCKTPSSGFSKNGKRCILVACSALDKS
jgi:hypothetical protein